MNLHLTSIFTAVGAVVVVLAILIIAAFLIGGIVSSFQEWKEARARKRGVPRARVVVRNANDEVVAEITLDRSYRRVVKGDANAASAVDVYTY